MKILGTELVFDLVKLIDAIGTLAAVFAGAWFAFRFERTHKSNEEVDRRSAAGRRALYTIINMCNIQVQARRDIVDPHRGKHDAWLNMAANYSSSYGVTTFEAGELSFLLEENTQLYLDIMIEEQRFALAMHLIEERSRVITRDVFTRLAAGNVAVGEQRPETEFKAILGPHIVRTLEVLTAGITTNIDENIASLVAVQDRLYKEMKRQFPNEKFLRMDFDGGPPKAEAVSADG